MNTRQTCRSRPASTQRGVVLFIALIVLVAMSLAGIAMVRSVDTATLIAGNIAFKKGAVQSGDLGTEAAVAWLTANNTGTTLHADLGAFGYYASRQDGLDLTGKTSASTADDVDWNCNQDDNSTCTAGIAIKPRMLPENAAGYTTSYVVHRMCSAAGNPNAVVCSTYTEPTASAVGLSKVGVDYGSKPLPPTPKIYFRITSRVLGPRDTVSFIQAFIAI